MGARRSGREAALQMLFQLEASGVTPALAIELFWRTYEDADPEGRSYADAIVHGVADNLEPIDKRLTAASQNWRLERMSRVDRNLLRLGTWELMFRTDIFNFINRANFGVPVRLLEAPGFGRATNTVTPGRRIQFSLKYEF